MSVDLGHCRAGAIQKSRGGILSRSRLLCARLRYHQPQGTRIEQRRRASRISRRGRTSLSTREHQKSQKNSPLLSSAIRSTGKPKGKSPKSKLRLSWLNILIWCTSVPAQRTHRESRKPLRVLAELRWVIKLRKCNNCLRKIYPSLGPQ